MTKNQKQCLKINGTVFAVNISVCTLLFLKTGMHSALSFSFGAVLAQIFSVTWFLLTVPLMDGPYFFIAAVGGFFFRLIILTTALLSALYLLNLNAFAAAASFLIVRFVLVVFEIAIAVKTAKNKISRG